MAQYTPEETQFHLEETFKRMARTIGQTLRQGQKKGTQTTKKTSFRGPQLNKLTMNWYVGIGWAVCSGFTVFKGSMTKGEFHGSSWKNITVVRGAAHLSIDMIHLIPYLCKLPKIGSALSGDHSVFFVIGYAKIHTGHGILESLTGLGCLNACLQFLFFDHYRGFVLIPPTIFTDLID